MSLQGFDHYIQREIFLRLREHEVAKYSDLQIKGLESSQFMYHLKELIRLGLVEKIEKGRYRLTRKGITTSQGFSTDTKNFTVSPLTYTLLFVKNTDGKWLHVQRTKQPFINQFACISGKVHMNETLAEAAQREWHESTSEPDIALIYRGTASVKISEVSGVLTHITGIIWFAEGIHTDWQTKDSRLGKLSWQAWQALDYKEFIPGWREIVEALDSSSHPFLLDMSFTL